MAESVDVVVVGGGVAGSTLGGALADADLSVVVLEKSEHFEDRVRGEWIAPWGVAEAKRLGIYPALVEAGGHHLTRHVGYDELLPPEVAEAMEIDLSLWHPDAPGPLTIEHVQIQNLLFSRARDLGAEMCRAVTHIDVEAGRDPRVRFRGPGGERSVSCRFVVGADGRSSAVRRQLGIPLVEDPIDHLIAGLLVDGLRDWPEQTQAIGKAGDIQYLIFPQGGGRARLYADYDAADRGRFSGQDGIERFLESFRMACVPGSGEIASATPLGPCRSYPSQDAWTESPVSEGAVLVGDAAGYNDPIIGQGLSIALRDVRLVRDLMLESPEWTPELFAPYVAERRERLRRLRVTAQIATRLGARFDPESVTARGRAFARIGKDPSVFPLAAAFAGPEKIPVERFSEDFVEALFAP